MAGDTDREDPTHVNSEGEDDAEEGGASAAAGRGDAGGNGATGAAGSGRPSNARQSAFPGEGIDDEEIEDAVEMYDLEELKHKRAVYTEAVRRKLAAEREGDEEMGGGDEMRGVRRGRGMPGRVLSGGDKRKRALAAERQILKTFQRMSQKFGVTAWVFGYMTSLGKPRIGAAESMLPWWVQEKVYESQAVRAHVAGRGELQQEINRLQGTEVDDLLKKLTGPQLHSLAAVWFPKCIPSVRDFPSI